MTKPISLHANGLTFSAVEAGEGPTVIMLHGFPDHNRTWRLQVPALAEAGYRVVAPNNRGYEPASQPLDKDYAMIRMAEDVVGWMNDLGVEKGHLVGHDWGAVIGYATAALAPERVQSLTTLAVPHLRRMLGGLGRYPVQLRNSWYMLFFQLNGISDVLVRAKDFSFIERLWRDWSPGWEWSAEEMEHLKRTFARPGVLPSALAYYRAFFRPLSRSGLASYRLLTSKLEVPTLALTGATDGCMDTRLWDEVMRAEDFPKGLRVERIEGAGHFMQQEKPHEVNSRIIDWLGRHSANSEF